MLHFESFVILLHKHLSGCIPRVFGKKPATGNVRIDLPLEVSDNGSLALLAIAGQLKDNQPTVWQMLGQLPRWSMGPSSVDPVGLDGSLVLKARLGFLASRFKPPPNVIRNR